MSSEEAELFPKHCMKPSARVESRAHGIYLGSSGGHFEKQPLHNGQPFVVVEKEQIIVKWNAGF